MCTQCVRGAALLYSVRARRGATVLLSRERGADAKAAKIENTFGILRWPIYSCTEGACVHGTESELDFKIALKSSTFGLGCGWELIADIN